MPGRSKSCLFALLFIFALGITFRVVSGGVLGMALLWVDTVENRSQSGNVQVALRLDDVRNVYGAEVHLSFDPTLLAVVDADEDKSGVQVSQGTCPMPGFIARNGADNQTGTIEYILTQLYPQAPCDGGKIATIDFQCLSSGTSAITITESSLAALGAQYISHTTQNGIVTCQTKKQHYSYLPLIMLTESKLTERLYFPLIMQRESRPLLYLPLIMLTESKVGDNGLRITAHVVVAVS
jgi:hypothetical protein